MSNRELVVLGTASQTPTRSRNQNGYLLRWDGEGLLFDPGEGIQRQMLFAGAKASEITHICITHFHGDHCLGLPGMLQRLSLDQVSHVVEVCYPADGREMFGRLRRAAIFRDVVRLLERPVDREGTIAVTPHFRLEAQSLSHGVPSIGYRLVEPDGRRMLPDKLASCGIAGLDIRHLQQQGHIVARGRQVTIEQVSEPRRGQRFAFIMDTRLCDNAFALAEAADMVVCESTYLQVDASLAKSYGHLTAAQAGRIAAESNAQILVLSHFSARYADSDSQRFTDEAAAVFGGQLIVAQDLIRIPLPRRRSAQNRERSAKSGIQDVVSNDHS